MLAASPFPSRTQSLNQCTQIDTLIRIKSNKRESTNALGNQSRAKAKASNRIECQEKEIEKNKSSSLCRASQLSRMQEEKKKKKKKKKTWRATESRRSLEEK
ncbi:hypothetical protein SDJN03_26576, partial [Cucurbita argyrosperma subsp. sororia]